MMTTFSFVHQGLLWGGLAVAIPVILHFWNRYQYQRIKWAAMIFLLDAYQKNQRRLQLQNLLLLLLRTLVIIVLVLLLARPFYQYQGAGSASQYSGQGQTLHLVLLDDSPSMGQEHNNRSCWDLARQIIVRLLTRLRPMDLFTLMRSSRKCAPDFHEVFLNASHKQQILSRLSAWQPADLACAWPRILPALLKVVEQSKAEQVQLYIISDCRRIDWYQLRHRLPGLRPPAKLLQVHLFDVGFAQYENAGIVAIEPRPRKVIRGLPVQLQVMVHNYGTQPLDTTVRLQIGSIRLPAKQLHHIPPQGRQPCIFEHTFTQAGLYSLQAQLGADAFRADNRYYGVVAVSEHIKVLIFDGAPYQGRGAHFFLAKALDPAGDHSSGIAVTVRTESAFGTDWQPDEYDLIFLTNLYHLPPTVLRQLENFTRQGGGLVIFLGPQVAAALYNQELYRQGQGLLPLALLPAQPLHAAEAAPSAAGVLLQPLARPHPLLRILQGANNPLLHQVHVYQAFRCQKGSLTSQARVLCWYADQEHTPAIIEQPYGHGRVLLFTTTADTVWTDWPKDPSFLVMCQEMSRYLLTSHGPAHVLPVASTIRFPLKARYTLKLTLRSPGQSTPRLLRAIPATGGFYVQWSRTARAGLYTFTLQARQDDSTVAQIYALNIPGQESQLRKAPQELLTQVLAPLPLQYHAVACPTPAQGSSPPNKQVGKHKLSLWPYLAITLLGLLLLESFYAWRCGAGKSVRPNALNG